jgi:outer membrane protein OmpA-like peptidoglycan-associated protein
VATSLVATDHDTAPVPGKVGESSDASAATDAARVPSSVDAGADAAVAEQPRWVSIYGGSVLAILDTIPFAPGSAIVPKTKEVSDLAGKLAFFLRTQPHRIRVDGHSDASEGEAGKRLSLERAEHVRAALVAHGADPSRVTAVGHGAQQPLESTRAGRTLNPRVSFTVLDASVLDAGAEGGSGSSAAGDRRAD